MNWKEDKEKGREGVYKGIDKGEGVERKKRRGKEWSWKKTEKRK